MGSLIVSGIGSLPFTEAGPALELIEHYLPAAPHWPQLPRRSRKEFFTHQFLGLLVELGLLLEGGKGWYFPLDSLSWVEGLTTFYELYLAAEAGQEEARERFAPSEEAAVGFYAFLAALGAGGFPRAEWVKGQIAGPVSVGLNLFDPEGRPAYYHPQLRDLLVKSLAQGASWQARKLARECGRPVAIFVDDPAVGSWGTSLYVGLEREMIVSDLAHIAAAVREAGALAGVHCCAGVDWSIPLAAGFDLLSFDAYGYFEQLLPYASELAGFLNRGGILAWGLAPTSPQAWSETPESLRRRWQRQVRNLEERGVSGELLRRQLWLTPSCGVGLLEPDLATHIYALAAASARELSRVIEEGGD
ncbi:MAG: hypothetical protein ACPLPT_00460 [Moorellales bacterium]